MNNTLSRTAFTDITDGQDRAALPVMIPLMTHGVQRDGHSRSVTMFEPICAQLQRCPKENLEPVIELAVESAREGREGRRIGTLFTFGDADAVLARSRPLILDPLIGHSDESRNITNLNLRGTVKELAQLDGAFVVE